MDPGIHGVRARWIQGFMAFQWPGASGTVTLMVSA
jgi:hypothetical protein